MRRPLLMLLLWSTAVFAVAPAAGAQGAPEPAVEVPADLPPGFTDGIPVGGDEPPSPDVPLAEDPTEDPAAEDPTGDVVVDEPAAAADVGPTASTSVDRATASSTRYFGDGAWEAIRQAAAAAPRTCGITDAQLTALVAAPVFKESSAATRPSSAPSPMTLSRYDEWNGTYAETSNKSANYGLYAFRNPNTSYVRAYWHPGIGIWQYDSAGIGAPYTAIERMNVRVVAGEIAAEMAARYCNPPPSVVGHTAPFTTQERRDAAWWPWWAGSTGRNCPLCQVEYDHMLVSPAFSNISLVSGISATGGSVRRSCTLPGSTGAVECWYVNPKVGVIQGATAWATLNPDDGRPTVAPAPLSHAFYVIKRNGNEERHWLRADTGYGTDISAVRRLGKNARPRSNQAGSGLTWASSSGLCDTSARRGNCVTAPVSPLTPPVGMRTAPASVGGTYRPVTLDADGDGRDDIFWYGPGSVADYVWLTRADGTFTSVPAPVGGTYSDVLALDADGDGRDDLLFYARSSGGAYLWTSKGDGTFTSRRILPGKGLIPLVADVDADPADEIVWYGPGSLPDAYWHWSGDGFRSERKTVGGNFQPFVGDFDGNGRDDIFWYTPGPGADYVWLHRGAGGAPLDVKVGVGGTYQPLVGDFDGDRKDDVFWYEPGTTRDSVWFGGPSGAFSGQTLTVSDTYQPVVADLTGSGRDHIIWYDQTGNGDLWTRWGADRTRTSTSLSLVGGYRPLVGGFSAGGHDGVFWYAPGPTQDWLWYR